MKRDTRHIPALLEPLLEIVNPRPGQTIVDCTLGLGGHAAEVLRRILPGGKLIGIDFDPGNIELARGKLSEGGEGFELFHNNFAALPGILMEAAAAAKPPPQPSPGGPGEGDSAKRVDWRVDAVIADLGVASPQIDDPARGFSYRQPGPLDMRMDPTRGRPASVLVNRLSEAELAAAFLELGDETDAPKIARLIVERRKKRAIETTEELMAIVCEARDFTIERAAGAKLHPAARTFQALRILVNRELANLDRLLAVLPECLMPGGLAAIISFHSGEDRRVKAAFRLGMRDRIYSEISPDVVVASEEEIEGNGRARSAKLRWARRG